MLTPLWPKFLWNHLFSFFSIHFEMSSWFLTSYQNTVVRTSTLIFSFICQHMAVPFLQVAQESLGTRILLCTSQIPFSALNKVHSIQRCGMPICLQFLLPLHVAFYVVQRLLGKRQSRVKSQPRKWHWVCWPVQQIFNFLLPVSLYIHLS